MYPKAGGKENPRPLVQKSTIPRGAREFRMNQIRCLEVHMHRQGPAQAPAALGAQPPFDDGFTVVHPCPLRSLCASAPTATPASRGSGLSCATPRMGPLLGRCSESEVLLLLGCATATTQLLLLRRRRTPPSAPLLGPPQNHRRTRTEKKKGRAHQKK